MRYLRFMDEQGRELTSYVHAHGVTRISSARAPGRSSSAAKPSCGSIAPSTSAASSTCSSEFWLREDDSEQLGGVERQEALESNLRELIMQRLSLPTLRVDQWIRFGAAVGHRGPRAGAAARRSRVS